MKTYEKYLEALKTFEDYVTVSEWAEKVALLYPSLLEKANKEADEQKNDTTGLREIAARIGSRVSTGGFDGYIKINDMERPRRVKYISKEELDENTTQEIEEDLEPLNRKEIEKKAEDKMVLKELYRLDEFRNIQKAFKTFFNLDFELDHAKALLNEDDAGEHHPDNFQLILKYHNGKKVNKNWERFTLDEQLNYIRKCFELHTLVANRFGVSIDENILNSLMERLKEVY
ncbi:HNH endonuclease [Halarcobacter sp.]|uniref:HNH endonuclease n=1 Tax=Halarcobacter sp. TaxID=2321133 RepID=UPI002AABBAF9|nr:HNH endonuclease [Halarcobacter sp.]